jgi:hypothetical protein
MATIYAGLAEALGIPEERVKALFYANGCDGRRGYIRGYEVAAELRRRFGLRPDERLGVGLWRRGVLAPRQAWHLEQAVWAHSPAECRELGLGPRDFRWE